MKIVIAIIILSVVIFLHEFGHFIVAKASGIRVLEFAIGMGPKLISRTRNGTVYSWRVFPIGGFCSMQGEDEDDESEGSFNAAPLPKRAAVVAAGPLANFFWAFVFSAVIVAAAGGDPARVEAVVPGSGAEAAGLETGDLILSYQGHGVGCGRELYTGILLDGVPEKEITLTVLRDGEKQTFSFAPYDNTRYMLGYQYNYDDEQLAIAGLIEGLPMEAAGFQTGDIITGMNGYEVKTAADLDVYWSEHPMDGTPISISYIRDGQAAEAVVTPVIHSEMTTGFDVNTLREKQGFLSGIRYSFSEMKYWLSVTVKSLGGLISGRFSVRELSGPVGIVSAMSTVIDEAAPYGISMVLVTIIEFIVMISVNLGIMNLLPLPALDGGRLVFFLIEAIRKKPVSRRVEGMVHYVGMMALLVLAVLIAVKDVAGLF